MTCHNKRAQVTIETGVISILITLGILVMGPYVIRSINSYFENANEQVKQSFEEDLKQADFDIITVPECKYDIEDYVCDDGCGTRNRRLYMKSNQDGCWEKIDKGCHDDPDGDCCEVNPGECGANVAAETGGSRSCPDGQREQQYICGSGPDGAPIPAAGYYDCEEDASCIFNCEGSFFDQDGLVATPCSADYQNGLSQNTPITYVDYGTQEDPAANCSDAKCQAYCPDGYAAVNNGAKCCEETTFSDIVTSSLSAGGSISRDFTADTPTAIFDVCLWTEDLINEITFYDESGKIILYDYHNGTDGGSRSEVICYKGVVAHKVHFILTEGGDKNSGTSGYYITYVTSKCADDDDHAKFTFCIPGGYSYYDKYHWTGLKTSCQPKSLLTFSYPADPTKDFIGY